MVRNPSQKDEIKIISRWTGIPVAKLTESERNKTLHLDKILHERVVGQDEAVELVTESIIVPKPESRTQANQSVLSYSLDQQV